MDYQEISSFLNGLSRNTIHEQFVALCVQVFYNGDELLVGMTNR